MRRADRLFRIVQHLRGGKLVTAKELAARLEVSERTIYRDMADLQASGLPIDGEAGVGYLMRDGYDLPPLMFTRDEVAALVVGARIVRAWGGTAMAHSAEDALSKIETVLPESERRAAGDVKVFAFDHHLHHSERQSLDVIDSAIRERRTLLVDYVDQDNNPTSRTLEPLGLYYWGKIWTLVAWCRLRSDFRMFRIDRFQTLHKTEESLKPEPGRTLEDFIASMSADQAPTRPEPPTNPTSGGNEAR